MAVNLAIVGISGRMGIEVQNLAESYGFRTTFGVTKEDQKSFTVKPSVTLVSKMDQILENEVDIVIDFSLPEITDSVIEWCVRNKKKLVSGTTGLTNQQKEKIRVAGQEIAILWSPNMSLGVAIVGRMLEAFSNLQDFDFQIEELHHKRKLDRPSGTALLLHQKLEKTMAKKLDEPLSIRGGGIFGIHKVWAMSEEEVITIEHTAMNRQVFAKGALKVAQWLVDQQPGRYSLEDMLFN